MASATICAARRSFSGLRYACRKQIVTASMPAAANWRAAASTCASSSGVSTSPAALTRSSTSMRNSRGTATGGLPTL
ncbi:hypothetical protein G6F35_014080 [Rhizopus arrhizus]|nr:hypothetical protein G6F24_016721 [Rhizopus arrhizus]KAG1189487.1 hypothetical protein G6F35_014080 [Rhizopus arrhizus]